MDATFGGEAVEGIVGNKVDEDMSRYTTLEDIRNYLKTELGEEKLTSALPFIIEFGDDILYEKNMPAVYKKLEDILTKAEIKKYLHFFANLAYYELEVSKAEERKKEEEEKAKQEAE
jgi:hypothetical protein